MFPHDVETPVEAGTEALLHPERPSPGQRMQQLVRAHPLASVGLTLGGGLLLGAVAHKLLAHHDTLGEALLERAGVNRLRDRVRRMV